jgi:endonuclease-8
MPEGDTIHTLARVLGPVLAGRTLDQVRIRGQVMPDLARRRIIGVTSHGKHLAVLLDDGRHLRSHLGLYGAWHRYRRDERWHKPARQASLVLGVEDQVFVCFNAREVEVMQTQGFRSLDQRNRLGLDLTRTGLGMSLDPDALWGRAEELLAHNTPIVDVLLDQRVAAGIGNVYKSEVLFLTRRSPLLRLQDLGPEDLAGLYRMASRLLNENLRGGPRVTRRIQDGRGLVWVYGRVGLPCLVCGVPIRRQRLGAHQRSTYWCPDCQPAPSRA